MSTSSSDVDRGPAELESSNRFLVQQVFKALGNEYRISVPLPGSNEEGEPLLFVKQKKLKIREDIRFRLRPDGDHVFMIKAKSVFEFRGRHQVLDGSDRVVGLLEKDFARSLLRSHWRVRDSEGNELFEGHEASWLIALLRRIASVAPEGCRCSGGSLPGFVLLRDGEQAGTYKRVLGKLRDRFVLELGGELEGVDRRLVIALAVALDALQDR